LIIFGDDEQATGGTVEPVDDGRIILETLRIFGLTLRGPRSCCTANVFEKKKIIIKILC